MMQYSNPIVIQCRQCRTQPRHANTCCSYKELQLASSLIMLYLPAVCKSMNKSLFIIYLVQARIVTVEMEIGQLEHNYNTVLQIGLCRCQTRHRPICSSTVVRCG